MVTEQNIFFRVQQNMSYIPFSQSKGWHDFRLRKKGSSAVYFIDDIENPSICAWGLVRRVPLFGKIVQIEGESYHNTLSKLQVKEFYEQIASYSKHHYMMTHISNDDVYNVNYEIGIRQAGFVRPLIMMNCPLSIIIDLPTWKASSKWKYEVKIAQKKNLSFAYIGNPNRAQAEIVCAMYAEMVHDKGLAHQLDVNDLQILLSNEHFKLFMVSTSDEQPLAFCIAYIYNKTAYYLIATTSIVAKKIQGCSRFMVNSLLEWLKDNKVERFDFGRIGPGKRSSNSVYEFKSSAGGTIIPYSGEWVFANSKLFEMLFSLMLNLKIKRW
jgi:lipid II:glycine glycyltransferase (peptidoglycan interpeptide bridge formation enzyme)